MAKPQNVSKGNTYEPPTAAQLKYAENLAIAKGFPRAYAIQAARKAMLGKAPVQPMGRAQCSELIDWLKSQG